MKKKIIIIIVSVVIIVIGIIVLLICFKKKDNPIEASNNTEIIEQEENIEINETNQEIENDIVEIISNETNTSIEEVKKETTQVKKPSSNNKKNSTSSEKQTKQNDNPIPPEPTISYYCPDGYKLDNDKCTHTVAANYVCPPNTHDYSNDGIPKDTYCVNLSDGYETEDGNCPSGYGVMQVLSFGSPTKYQCLKLYKKEYTCEDGYNLNGKDCIKTIDALKR